MRKKHQERIRRTGGGGAGSTKVVGQRTAPRRNGDVSTAQSSSMSTTLAEMCSAILTPGHRYSAALNVALLGGSCAFMYYKYAQQTGGEEADTAAAVLLDSKSGAVDTHSEQG